MPKVPLAELRCLVLVLGDQLDPDAACFEGFDATHDMVWMAEAVEESTHVWSSQPRTAMFLAAMRHFAHALRVVGRPVAYTLLDDPWLYHAQLSAALNLKPLNPREVAAAAVADCRAGCAPLASVEGFVRQILGWRHRHGLLARCAGADADPRLRQPHPAADGHRPFCADARHEPALRWLPLRPRATHRRHRLPVHRAALGLPDAPPIPARRQPAHGPGSRPGSIA